MHEIRSIAVVLSHHKFDQETYLTMINYSNWQNVSESGIVKNCMKYNQLCCHVTNLAKKPVNNAVSQGLVTAIGIMFKHQ